MNEGQRVRGNKYLRIVQWLFALLVVGVLIHHVQLQEVLSALQTLTVASFTLLMLISFLLVYISALKWSLFIAAFGKKLSVISLCNLYLVGYFINTAIPSTVGGDAVRSWYVGKKTDHHTAIASTLLERYTGFVAMVVMAAIGSLCTEIISVPVKIGVFLVAAGVVVGTTLVLIPQFLLIIRYIPFARSILPHIMKIREALFLAAKNPVLLGKAFVLSFFYHTVAVVNVVSAGWALDWFSIPYETLFVIVPIALIAGSIPLTPSGLGIQEGAFYVLLSLIGATPGQALGIGILLRLKSYLLALLGGILWLYIKYTGGAVVRTTSEVS